MITLEEAREKYMGKLVRMTEEDDGEMTWEGVGIVYQVLGSASRPAVVRVYITMRNGDRDYTNINADDSTIELYEENNP